MNNQPIMLVGGEPNSVFLEIFFKSIKSKHFKSPLILIISKNLLVQQMKKLGYQYDINLIKKNFENYSTLNNESINLIDVNYNFKKPFDKISKKSNKYIEKCFKIAIEILKKNNFSKFINGPISKRYFLRKKFSGITEYLASKTNTTNKVVMLIYNKKLSVSPITTHIPLKDVHKNLSKTKIKKQIILISKFYEKKFKKKIKIAVTGLNPHCESNYTSSEENKIIKPAIKDLTYKKYSVYGPFPADTIFMKEQSKKYEVIIGMYHDQVLTPLKSLFGFNAINITLGLPFIRISPDHGPNHSMLGKNLSNPRSLIEAIKFLDT